MNGVRVLLSKKKNKRWLEAREVASASDACEKEKEEKEEKAEAIRRRSQVTKGDGANGQMVRARTAR